MIKFIVLGEPTGKGRPKFSRRGSYVNVYTPRKTETYEERVKAEYIRQCNLFKFNDDAALDMRIMAYFKIPNSVSKKKKQLMLEKKIRPTKKPDFDNISKIIADSLNKIAYRDDAQITDAMIRKFYSETPRVEISISEICE